LTIGGIGLGGVSVTLSGSATATATTAPDGTYAFVGLSAGGNYTVTPASFAYIFAPLSRTFDNLSGNVTADFVGSLVINLPVVQFETSTLSVSEGAVVATVNVKRTGDTRGAASVRYSTMPDAAVLRCDEKTGHASERCDYATTIGELRFAPGETTKTFEVSLVNDAFMEGSETVGLVLSNPAGASLGSADAATLTVMDDDTTAPSTATNPIYSLNFFVRQQYLDFLSREPEANEPWSNVLNRCPNVFNLDAQNLSAGCDRLIVSQSFFGAPEFRLKGLYAFTFYRVAFNRRPAYEEIIPDMMSVSGATTEEVYQKRAAYPVNFTTRPEFKGLYDALDNAAFVNTLLDRYGLQSITSPDPANPEGGTKVVLTRADLINRLGATGAQTLTRAQVLRAVVESNEVGAAEYNRAFVAMQYYGYLRRTPEEDGYQAWLRVINQDPNNIRIMVNGFMNSTEYRMRFGQP
jgi:hypothetical protein